MKFEGTVVQKPFASGSKSEHPAIMLETREGKDYVLRRQGGNAFRDEVLEQLAGKKIRAEGSLAGYTLIMTEWTEL